jgi:hypothetical protein
MRVAVPRDPVRAERTRSRLAPQTHKAKQASQPPRLKALAHKTRFNGESGPGARDTRSTARQSNKTSASTRDARKRYLSRGPAGIVWQASGLRGGTAALCSSPPLRKRVAIPDESLAGSVSTADGVNGAGAFACSIRLPRPLPRTGFDMQPPSRSQDTSRRSQAKAANGQWQKWKKRSSP